MKNKLFIFPVIFATALVLLLIYYLLFPKMYVWFRANDLAKQELACAELANNENERFNSVIRNSFDMAPEETNLHYNTQLETCYFQAGQTTFLGQYVSVDYWVTNLNTGERVLTYSSFDDEMTEEEFFEQAAYYMSN